ncbi:sensor histidine kinase [Microbispora sp. NPDC004025]
MRAPQGRGQWLVLGVGAALLFAVVAAVEMAADPGRGGTNVRDIALAAAVAVCFPVAALYPVTGMTIAMLSFPLALAAGAEGLGGAQLIAELVLVAHAGYRSTVRRGLTAAAAAALVPAAALTVFGESPWEFLFFGALVSCAWGLGALLRREQTRSAQLAALADALAAEREARARAAVDEERARISRELHDAVAHTLSVMTMQAGVLRRRLADRPVERDALAQVEELGRRSVEEIRRVVGLLRPDAADGLGPPPSLRRIEDLVAQVRSAGLDISLAVTGEPVSLPAGLDMSAYRVAQEALTNVLRHAGADRAAIEVAYRPGEVALRVTDDGRGAPAASAASAASPGAPATRAGGHGLVGMRERVGMFGGTLRTGPREAGGYEVYATFPVPSGGIA